MAHQTHSLPWNTLASLFKYKSNPVLEPQHNDILFLHKGTEPKEIGYFCHALAKQVHEFATTERAKYESSDAYRQRAEAWVAGAASGGTASGAGAAARPVFPDAIQSRYFGPKDDGADDRFRRIWGGPGLQRVDAWTGDIYAPRIRYADTLKLLMLEAAGAPPALSGSQDADAATSTALRTDLMESMLLLANRPDVRANFRYLVREPYGDFGLSRVPAEAIRSYVYANLLVALQDKGSDVAEVVRDVNGRVPDPGRKNYMDLPSYKGMLYSVAGEYDGDAQNLMHWDFYLRRTELSWDDKGLKDVLADRGALVEYLKAVWRVLVIYVVVLREAGLEPDIEQECKAALNDLFELGLNMYTTPSD